MPQGMLGNLSLAATRGPRNDLEEKLAGSEGEAWLVALKRFLRKENPWPEAKQASEPVPAPPALAVPMWLKVSGTIIEVNLDAPLKLTLMREDVSVDWTLPGKTGWVRIELKGDKLYQDGIEVVLHLDPGQKDGKSIRGDKLRDKLKDVPGHMHPNVLDALLENAHLIPESWKNAGYIFSWRVGFRLSDAFLFVRCLVWNGGRWNWVYGAIDAGWNSQSPAAVSAS